MTSLTISTVKVANPKGYKTMFFINAGLASSIDNYHRVEESRQVTKIVEDLIKATKGMEYFEAVKFIYPSLKASDNREDIKTLILKRYCSAKVKEEEGAN